MFKHKNQGVTLLLAIMVLSAVTAISFSLATILFIELRSSSDLVRTESSYYGTSAIAEEAIFFTKRKVCTNCTYTSDFGNNVTLFSTPVRSSTTTPIFQDRIPPATSFTTGKIYDFFDPNSNNPLAGSGYGKARLTFLSTDTTEVIHVYMCEFDPSFTVDPSGSSASTYNTSPCSSSSNNPPVGLSSSYWALTGSNNTVLGFSYPTSYEWNLNPNKQQKLIVFNDNVSGGNVFIKIETFGPSPSYVPTGLPYAGQTAVDVSTFNSSVSRKIRVVVPN